MIPRGACVIITLFYPFASPSVFCKRFCKGLCGVRTCHATRKGCVFSLWRATLFYGDAVFSPCTTPRTMQGALNSNKRSADAVMVHLSCALLIFTSSRSPFESRTDAFQVQNINNENTNMGPFVGHCL